MRGGQSIILTLLAATGLLLSCFYAQAGATSMPKEPIIIEGLNPARFDHVVHRRLEIPCGKCHHDDKHKQRSDEEIFAITDGNELRCNNCHNKNLANTYLQSREDIFHTICRACHAVGINGVRGPRKCEGCHIREDGGKESRTETK